VGSHQRRAEGQNPLPRPAAHAAGDAAQDMVGFFGLQAHTDGSCPAFHPPVPPSPSQRAALTHFIPQPVLIAGVAPTQVQDSALGLVEPHEVHMGPLLQLVQVPLDGILSLRHVNHTTQLGVGYTFCKALNIVLLPEGHITALDWSTGGTVCKMDSVGRQRS